MAGFSESLDFDITAALRQVDVMTAALGQTTQRFSVDLARSLDQLRSGVAIEVDGTALRRDIERAIESADTEADVTADTTRARREVDRLGDAADKAAGRTSILRQALAGLSAVGIIQGVRAIADAGSSLAEQVSGSEVVFGNAAVAVQSFADQAERIGIAEDAALRAANAFGQLALSAGLSNTAVSDFATTLVARGADIASLRDLDLTETLERLRSGLVGETEPLRNLGVFLNEATLEAKAMELGLGAVGRELTDAEKIQARYAVILEQSNIAAGNFALTADGLANTQRRVAAVFRNEIIEVGQRVEDQFLDLAVATEDELIPRLGALADRALPSVLDATTALTPLLGTTLDLMIALAPALDAVAKLVGAIPEPLLAIGGGVLVIDRVAGAVGRLSNSARTGSGVIAGLTRGAQGLYRSLGDTPGLRAAAGLTAAIVGLGVASETVEGGVGGLAAGVVRLADSFTGFGAARTDKVTEEIQELIGGFDLNKLNESAAAIGVLREELDALDDREGKGRLPLGIGFLTTGDADRAERIRQIREQVEALEGQAQAEIDAGLVTGRFTESQVDAAVAVERRQRSTSPVIDALGRLRDAERAEQVEVERTVDRYQPLADQLLNVGENLGLVRDAAPQVANAVSDIRLGAEGADRPFLDLAVAIEAAKVSGAELQPTADLLGISVENLETFVERATSRLNDFVDTATSRLPSVSSVFSETLDASQQAASEIADMIRAGAADRIDDLQRAAREAGGEFAGAQADAIRDAAEAEAASVEGSGRVTAAAFAEGLRVSAFNLADFRADLSRIADAGFAELAANIAEQGPVVGRDLANELDAAIAGGNLTILENLQAATDEFERQWSDTTEFFRTELGPELVLTTGLIGQAITDNFGANLDFEERIRIAAGLAASGLDTEFQAVAAVAAAEGEGAAQAYADALDLEGPTIAEAIRVGIALRDNLPLDEARVGGQAIIDAIVGGMETQAVFDIARIEGVSASIAERAVQSVKDNLGIGSPSKVFMAIGANLTESLAAGMVGSVSVLDKAGAKLSGATIPRLGLAGSPASAAALDDSRIVATLERLTARLDRPNQFTITGTEPVSTGYEVVRQMAAEQYRQGRR